MTADLHTDPDIDLTDDECGHTIVVVARQTQHHEIPDDSAPHAPTSECSCGPQRHFVTGHVVYEHIDQDEPY